MPQRPAARRKRKRRRKKGYDYVHFVYLLLRKALLSCKRQYEARRVSLFFTYCGLSAALTASLLSNLCLDPFWKYRQDWLLLIYLTHSIEFHLNGKDFNSVLFCYYVSRLLL